METLNLEPTEQAVVTGSPFWLNIDPEPVYAVLHGPSAGVRSRSAALILPTFGWENECSYLARREWATVFAQAGVSTLRFDFPGTDDSVGSPLRPGRWRSWVDATSAAARWLRHTSGCERLVVVGVGLGAMVAYQAASEGALVDDLILWAVRASGRAYVREQQAFGVVATGAQPDERDANRPDGAIGLAGHRMSEATAAAVSAVDLTSSLLPQAKMRRVLLIGRDGSGVDKRFQDHLEQSGVDLTVVDVNDYRLLVMVPDMRQSPTATIESSVGWFVDGLARANGPVQPSIADASTIPTAVNEIEFEQDGVRIRERLIQVQFNTHLLFAILSEPIGEVRAPFCLVSINSAWLRRTGPSRLMVDLTRRAATIGVAAARLDLPGLGDSQGSAPVVYERDEKHNVEAVAALSALYDVLQRSGVANQFIPAGFCLGGYVVAASAIADSRVVGVVGINPQLSWSARQRRQQRRWAKELAVIGATSIGSKDGHHLGLLRPLVERTRILRKRAEKTVGPWLMRSDMFLRMYWLSYVRNICRVLRNLGARGVAVLLVSSSNERLMRDVASGGPTGRVLARWPNLKIAPVAADSHMLHPLWSQDETLSIILAHLRQMHEDTARESSDLTPKSCDQVNTAGSATTHTEEAVNGR